MDGHGQRNRHPGSGRVDVNIDGGAVLGELDRQHHRLLVDVDVVQRDIGRVEVVVAGERYADVALVAVLTTGIGEFDRKAAVTRGGGFGVSRAERHHQVLVGQRQRGGAIY